MTFDRVRHQCAGQSRSAASPIAYIGQNFGRFPGVSRRKCGAALASTIGQSISALRRLRIVDWLVEIGVNFEHEYPE
jgi:hypothetical protein